LKQQWETLAAKINALNRRERSMVLVAALAVLAVVMNTLLLEPLAQRKKTMLAQMFADRGQMQDAQQQLQSMVSAANIDPDTPNRARLASLQQQMQEVDRDLQQAQNTLVSPDHMAVVLEGILKKDGQLKLVSLKTLPASGLLDAAAAEAPGQPKAENKVAATTEAPVYRHGVELTVEGRYLDMMQYLAELERLPWHILWSSITLSAGEYPISTMTVTVYTLSLDKTWLSI
jgi:MSHA biogenesis protein MshJ